MVEHPFQMKNLKTQKLYLQVYNEIKGYIIQNSLKPGDKLPTEMEMCELLGVSRNVLREAIKSLEITGVVHSTPGVGIVIQEFSTDYLFNSLIYSVGDDGIDMLRQFEKIRNVLELGFSHEAFDSLAEQEQKQLEVQVNRMDAIAHNRSKNFGAPFGVKFAEADAAFHRILFSKLNMPLLTSLTDAFWAYDKHYKLIANPQYLKCVTEDHARILNALKENSYERFYDSLKAHYDSKYTRDRYQREIDV
ncbi:MAG: GntR family transcriptional regulator [Oscillospiraceae bacterium]